MKYKMTLYLQEEQNKFCPKTENMLPEAIDVFGRAEISSIVSLERVSQG